MTLLSLGCATGLTLNKQATVGTSVDPLSSSYPELTQLFLVPPTPLDNNPQLRLRGTFKHSPITTLCLDLLLLSLLPVSSSVFSSISSLKRTKKGLRVVIDDVSRMTLTCVPCKSNDDLSRAFRTSYYAGLSYVYLKVSIVAFLELGVFTAFCGLWIDACSLVSLFPLHVYVYRYYCSYYCIQH